MKLIRQLWHDEGGAISAMGMILMTSIVVIGAIVGFTTLRDQIVQEMGDMALALENLNQSFTTSTATYTDPGPFPTDVQGSPPACLNLEIPAGS